MAAEGQEYGDRVSAVQNGTYRGLLLFAATALALWAFFMVLRPFLLPIAWALCLAAITARPYRWLAQKLGRPRVAAFAMVILTALLILTPVIGVTFLIVEEIQQLDFEPVVRDFEAHLPNVQAGIEEWALRSGIVKKEDLGEEGEENRAIEVLFAQMRERLPDNTLRLLMGRVAAGTLSIVSVPVAFLIGFLITLVTLYFVYLEAPRIRDLMLDLLPLPRADTSRILGSLHSTTSAAIMGGVLVALIQGALGGVSLAIADIQGVWLWSLVMAIFSLLPFGGTAIVWVPAGVYLLLTGDTASGWFVLAWGTLIVGASDNLLRPWILSKTGARDIHPLLLFFAILSGIGLFGISGLVFGPLLIALLTTMVQIYRARATAVRAQMGASETAPSGDG